VFQITRFPSSGSFIQYLAKITIMVLSVDMDVVGVMATYLPVVHVCTALSREASLDSAVHTCTTDKYAAIAPTMSMSMDTIEPLL